MTHADSRGEIVDTLVGGVVILSPVNSVAARRKLPVTAHGGAERLDSALRSAGLAVLRVHPSGAGKAKMGNRAVMKSFRSAIDGLAVDLGENGNRIAVVAEGKAADQAVLAASSDHRVRSFCLLSGRLSEEAKDVLTAWRHNPSLSLVSSEDKKSLRDMTDVYFGSSPATTDIRVFEQMGRGSDMFESWARQFPQSEPLEATVAGWIRGSLSSVGRVREVSFESEDGWEIFGNLLMPDPSKEKAPGIVLLHSGRSDRHIFVDLEQLLVRAGFAVLNIDWRGRGKSINKGRYFDLSKTERANGKLDAKAAIEFLSSMSEVDRDRIGLVGVVHGAEHAVRGSIDDSRVKAIAVLTGYMPASDEEQRFITSGKVQVMYVTCQGHRRVTKVMRELYEQTPGKLTRLIVYDGGAIGYQLFELDDKLEPAIVDWLKEGLTK